MSELLCDVCKRKPAEFIAGGVGFCETHARAFIRGDIVISFLTGTAAHHRDGLRVLLLCEEARHVAKAREAYQAKGSTA